MSTLIQRFSRLYLGLAQRRAWACLAVFALTLSIRLALLPWMHVPEPSVHDEFSYLLAADTYASGRLANPPHRFWQHFETFQVLQQPTYASKYPPLQGLVLAFGQKTIGIPWAGVLLSAALMCAAICWMLQGWISPGLALFGGLLFTMHIGIFSYWMNSYWGGAVPAIGGALVFGAIGRIVLSGAFAPVSTLAIGLAILANSRPYEAAVLGLISAATLGWWIWKRRVPFSVTWRRVALPAAGILVITAGWIAYDNYRVTGNPVTLPYQVHDRQYDVAPLFVWSKMRPEPVYRHAVMRKFWAEWHVNEVKKDESDPSGAFLLRLSHIYDFCFGLWPLAIPALIWPYPLKNIQERMTVVFLAAALAALAPLTGFAPHYAAAYMSVIYLRFLQSLQRLPAWRPGGKQVGRAAAVLLGLLIPWQFGVQVVKQVWGGEYAPKMALERDAVVQKLAKQPGRKLVLVRYSPDHYVHHEWVYNNANIDAEPIIWAREMGPQQDRPLVEYFRDRAIWLLEPDQSPPRLVPYPGIATEASRAAGRSVRGGG